MKNTPKNIHGTPIIDPTVTSQVVITVPRPLKSRWITQSQKRGMKLTDWIIQKLERTEMNDRNDITRQILDGLGPDGDAELAEQIYEELRADDRIYYDEHRGLVLRADVDLLAVAAQQIQNGATRKQ